MDTKYFNLFKSVLDSSDRKKIIAILLIIPIAMGFFFHFYYIDRNQTLKSETQELKLELKSERANSAATLKLYISAVEECDNKVAKVDSIHIAKYLSYRDETDKKNAEITQQWRQDYKEAMTQLMKARKANEKITKEISHIKE